MVGLSGQSLLSGQLALSQGLQHLIELLTVIIIIIINSYYIMAHLWISDYASFMLVKR